MGNRVIFLDRDGTICRDVSSENFAKDKMLEILPLVPEAICLLREHGFKIIVITNQPGISVIYFSEDDLELMHKNLQDCLHSSGADIDAIYHCPHSDIDNCECRKPNIGMMLLAKKRFDVDFSTSFMIGDSWRDIAVGNAVGCKSILLRGNHGDPGIGEYMYAEDLFDAAMQITSEEILKNK